MLCVYTSSKQNEWKNRWAWGRFEGGGRAVTSEHIHEDLGLESALSFT